MTRATVVAFVFACSPIAAAPAHAQSREPSLAVVDGPHLRADGVEPRALVADAVDRSPTFRSLVDRVEGSDLIVYVRMEHFSSSRLEGRIGFVAGASAAAGGPRILLIELACPRRSADQEATLAHELRHAAEIADAPWVDGPAALARYYAAIGESGEVLDRGVAFETAAAREIARRVRREIASAPRSAHEH